MTNLKVLKPDNPILRLKCNELSLKELKTRETQLQIEELLDYVYETSNKGEKRDKSKPSTVGLSANQLGLNKSIVIVDLGIGHKSYNDIHVLINPEITWKSKTIINRDEGCVNLDHIRGLVSRSKRVKVSALDRSGNKIQLDLTGWSSILLQHEIDHINGILFIDHLNNPKNAHLVKEGQFE